RRQKVLRLIDIHTYYGDSYILQGVSLRVEKSSVVALLGRNGMGKTTTINSIVGLNPPRRGQILFKDVEITGFEPFRIGRMGLGLVPQGRRIFPSLTVKENLTIVPSSGRTQIWNIEKLMSLFPRLKERINARAKFLSGGEQQMLAIARALMGNPEVLLMDEPSEGLAPLLVQEVSHVIQRLKKESSVSILLVEQNLGLAINVADFVYIMSKGTVVFKSTTLELNKNEEVKARHLGV
ncbi:MAG: ABC transporter ATP-binding protein, partial [Pseudomonadota bacterium]